MNAAKKQDKTIRGHFGPTRVDDQVHLVNAYLDVPPEVIELIEASPESEGEGRKFSLKLNREKIELAEQATNGLIISRGLKEPQSITMGDVLSLYLAKVKPGMDGMEILAEARQHYETWRKEASMHGMIIAMTDDNELLNEAQPYPDDFGQPASGASLPSWRKRIPHIPQPERKLTDPYENRLKQVMDFLEKAGDEFSIQFYSVVNNNVAKVIREVSAETDNAGFPAKPAGGAVHGTPGTIGRNKGKTS